MIPSSHSPACKYQNPLHVNELESSTSHRPAYLFPVVWHVRSQQAASSNPRQTCHFTLYHAMFRSIEIRVIICSYIMLLFVMPCYAQCYVLLCFVMFLLCLAIPCYVYAIFCYAFVMFCYVLPSAAIARFSRFPSPQNEIVNEMTSAYTFIRLSRSCENSSTSTLSFISVKEERLWLQQTRRR